MIRHWKHVLVLAVGLASARFIAAQEVRPGPIRTLFIEVRAGADTEARPVEVPLDIGEPAFEKTLCQALPLPEGFPALKVVRYLPAAVLSQEVRPDAGPEGRPAMLLGVDGPKQSYRRWLVAGDPKHHRLISLIGCWSHISVGDREARDACFAVFRDPSKGEPWLVIRCPGVAEPSRIRAKALGNVVISEAQAAVHVIEYLPHFSMGEDRKPVNLSDRPVNPAARVRIERAGLSDERWVFTRMPGYGKDPADPLDISLESALASDGPSTDFCLVSGPGPSAEIWSGGESGAQAEPVEVGRKLPVPGSRYTFHVERIEPAGKLVETWDAVGGGLDATAVVQVQTTLVDGSTTATWLPLGVRQEIPAPSGSMSLTFRRKLPDLPSGHPQDHR